MKDVDWNLIKSFVAVAETGSLSAAARKLSSSQPTLGRHISELEQALDVTLFRRGRQGHELTEAGALLYERGQAVAEQATAFSLLALGSVEAVEGTVRISASEVVAAFVLPEIIARLGLEEPGIEIEVAASNQVENLLRRDADIAIRMVWPMQLRPATSNGAADLNPSRISSTMTSSVSTVTTASFVVSLRRAFHWTAVPSVFGATTRSCIGKRCAPAMVSVSHSGRWSIGTHMWSRCCLTWSCRNYRYGLRCTVTCVARCASAASWISCTRR